MKHTKNKDTEETKKEEVKEDETPNTEDSTNKTYHMEKAIIMGDGTVDDIRKDTMEVLGDSLKIKNLEDKIENMLVTRTKVKDTKQ